MKHKITIITIIALIFLSGCSKNPDNQAESDSSLAPKKENIKIVAFGDSLTAGYNLPEEDSYPSQLQQLLSENGFTNYEVINAGVSGDTSKSALERTDWVLKVNPQIVILGIGANDGLRGLNIEQMSKNISTIIEKLRANNAKVILAGMKIPLNLGPFYTTRFEKVYDDLAAKYEIPFIPFLLEGVAMNPKLNLDDGIHPNKDGYKIVASNVFKILEKELNK